MKRFSFFVLVALLEGLGGGLRAAACSPVSATVCFEADDYFYFYVNGNAVVNPSGFDPGAPPVCVSVPIGYFNAPGVPNYFAAAVRNSAANFVGGAWVLSITCADGSRSYITNEDNTYTMYDDTTGAAPPPVNWTDPAFTDPGSLFTGTPILAAPIFWFSPALTHPLTGATLQMLSHSSSGTQSSNNEILYFRQSIVLPVYSPTPTPSPVPTYPPGCGVPNFQEAKVLASGCLGGTGTVTAPGSGSYSFSAQANQLLVLRLCTSSSSSAPSNVRWAGQAMTLFAASNVGSSDGNRMYSYYLANPLTSGTYTFSYPSANCSWNVVSELYNNVDVSNPVAGTTVKVGGNAAASSPYSFNFNFTTSGPNSLVSVFITSDQIQNSGDKPVSTNLATDMNLLSVGPSSVDGGGGEAVAGFYKAAFSPGSQAFTFNLNQANRWWDAQPMEIRGNACGTDTPTVTPAAPSPTATPTATPPPTSTPTATRSATPSASPSFTLTYSFTAGPSPTPSATPTATRSSTPSPSATSTPSASPTNSPSPTDSPTQSPGPSPTDSPTRSATPTPSPSPTDSPTLTASPTQSPSPTVSPSFTASPTVTETRTPGAFSQQERLLKLRGLYPMPFAETLHIYFTLRVDASVTFSAYDVAGEPLFSVQSSRAAGKNLLDWDGQNANGGRCASGAYILRLQAEGVDRSTDDLWARAVIAR